MGENRKIFGPLLVSMQNQFLLVNYQMPDTLAQAYTIMVNYNCPATTAGQNASVSQETAQLSVYSLGMSFLHLSSNGEYRFKIKEDTRKKDQCFNFRTGSIL